MPNADGSAYEGSVYPEVPFHPYFADVGVTFVRGGNPNIFGHALFRFGSAVGYIHVHSVLAYPSLIPAKRFQEYLDDNEKKTIYKIRLPLPNPLGAMDMVHHLRRHQWFWAGVPHNCVAFCEQILQAGGCDWEQISNLPMVIAGCCEPDAPPPRPAKCDVEIYTVPPLPSNRILRLRKGKQIQISAKGTPPGGSYSWTPRVGDERDGLKTVQQGYDECIVMATDSSGDSAVTVRYRAPDGREDLDSIDVQLLP